MRSRRRGGARPAPPRRASPSATRPPPGRSTACPASRARGGDARGTGDAGAAVAAVAPRVLAQVLLMIALGVVELRRVDDLGGDAAVAGRAQRALIGVARGLGDAPLLGRERVDAGAVLRADVVALPPALPVTVRLPAHLEPPLVRDRVGVQHDP